ncbi:MAG: DEAD/DEAH box helicase [Pseudomonadota bacterium]
MTFEKLGLTQSLLQTLMNLEFTTPTPIQEQAIPLLMQGHDVMGLAQTGTGKTGAFGLPLIDRLQREPMLAAPGTVSALVLAPTRELAQQIATSLRLFAKRSPLKIGLIVGGQSIHTQANRLAKGSDILVATPGRLMDHMKRRSLSLDEVKYLVLDEADQMLDLGFIHDLRRIAKAVPSERQTLMFSATMPKLMDDLAKAFLKDPVRVEVTPPGRAADKIKQSLCLVERREKPAALRAFLASLKEPHVIVFARTKHGSDKLQRSLEKAGFAAAAIHGNKSQGQRNRALDAFKKGEIRVLVATDVAARGIDIPGVTHVINYDLPEVADVYVHRIGRTARAGADGAAITLCAPDESKLLHQVQKLLGMKIDKVGMPAQADEAPEGDWFADNRAAEPAHKTQGKKPFGNKPRRPRKPHRKGQRPPTEAKSDRPKGDRPNSERPKNNRPKRTKPRKDMRGRKPSKPRAAA